MTTVILINGEKQVGKTTLARQIMDALNAAGRSVETYSLVRPIFPAALAIADVQEAIDYEDFKRQYLDMGLGLTGRDVMIAMGNAARGMSPYFLNAVFQEYALRNQHVDVWVIENWGFAVEYEFFLESEPATIFGTPVLIHLDSRATRRYEHGEQFDGDNRFCLRDLAHLLNPTVDEVVKRVTGEYKMEFKFDPEEALSKLNVDDDSDWEDDGRPSFAKLRAMTGRPDLSDEEIQAIVNKHGLSRQLIQSWGKFGAVAGEVDEGPEPEGDDPGGEKTAN